MARNGKIIPGALFFHDGGPDIFVYIDDRRRTLQFFLREKSRTFQSGATSIYRIYARNDTGNDKQDQKKAIVLIS